MNHSPLHWLTSGISQWDPDICQEFFERLLKPQGLYSLVTEVDQPGTCGDIWKSIHILNIARTGTFQNIHSEGIL